MSERTPGERESSEPAPRGGGEDRTEPTDSPNSGTHPTDREGDPTTGDPAPADTPDAGIPEDTSHAGTSDTDTSDTDTFPNTASTDAESDTEPGTGDDDPVEDTAQDAEPEKAELQAAEPEHETGRGEAGRDGDVDPEKDAGERAGEADGTHGEHGSTNGADDSGSSGSGTAGKAGGSGADRGAGGAGGGGDRAGAGGGRPSGRRRRRLALAVSVFGELLITAGVVLALFVLYSLWWTNLVANREAARESDRVRESWAQEKDDEPGALDTRDGIGFLHVPSMNGDEILVKKGTDPKKLNQGIAGYYTDPVKSAMPQDDKGNFSLAAHRDGHGAKFHRIDEIENGDPIVFESKDTWFVYKTYKILPETSKYNVDVLDPVPKESGKEKAGRYITLTTCTPVYTSRHRYVVWGELERTEKVDAERTPPKEIR